MEGNSTTGHCSPRRGTPLSGTEDAPEDGTCLRP